MSKKKHIDEPAAPPVASEPEVVIDDHAESAMVNEGGPTSDVDTELVVVEAAAEPPKPPPAPLGPFPTLIRKGHLKRYRVSCDGHPTLNGEAIDESEAIRAYRQHLNITGDNVGSKSLKFTVEPA